MLARCSQNSRFLPKHVRAQLLAFGEVSTLVALLAHDHMKVRIWKSTARSSYRPLRTSYHLRRIINKAATHPTSNQISPRSASSSYDKILAVHSCVSRPACLGRTKAKQFSRKRQLAVRSELAFFCSADWLSRQSPLQQKLVVRLTLGNLAKACV